MQQTMTSAIVQTTSEMETQVNNQACADAPATCMSGGESVRGKIDPKRYKTRLCRHFFEKGACPFAQRCAFAHGEHELRPLEETAAACGASKLEDPCCAPIASAHVDYTANHNTMCACPQCHQPYTSGSAYAPTSLPYEHSAYHGSYPHYYDQTSNYPYAPSTHENYNGYVHSSPYSYNTPYPNEYTSAPYTYPSYYQQPQELREQQQQQQYQQPLPQQQQQLPPQQQQATGAQGVKHTYTINPYATYPSPTEPVASGYSQYKPVTPTQSVPAEGVRPANPPNAFLP